MGVATLVGKSRAQRWEWSAASVASERTGMGKTKKVFFGFSNRSFSASAGAKV